MDQIVLIINTKIPYFQSDNFSRDQNKKINVFESLKPMDRR